MHGEVIFKEKDRIQESGVRIQKKTENFKNELYAKYCFESKIIKKQKNGFGLILTSGF
jgi:hypothetical protein